MSVGTGYLEAYFGTNMLSMVRRPRACVSLPWLLLGLVAFGPLLGGLGFELLDGRWLPVFEPDAISSSSITWVYADFIAGQATFATTKTLQVGEEECREMCAVDPLCVGIAPSLERCTYYGRGGGVNDTASMQVNRYPIHYLFAFAHRRKIPSRGLLVQVKVDNGILRTPPAPLLNGLYQIDTHDVSMNLDVVFTGHPLKLQFVVSTQSRVTHRRVSDAQSEGIAAGVSALVALVIIGLFFFIVYRVHKIGDT
jgi:hypothetical protein